MKAKKFDAAAMFAAIASGAAYNFAIEGAAKKVDFVNENYMVVKSLGAAVIGSAMVYFSKKDAMKAGGYGLLGVAGASGASKLATIAVSSGNPMQGTSVSDTLKRINTAMSAKKKALPVFNRAAAGQKNIVAQNVVRPTSNRMQLKTPNWGALAFSDSIYGFN